MKILVIDNGTHFKKKLATLLEEHDVVRVGLTDITPNLHNQGFDLIVISGAYNTHSVKYYGNSVFANEQEFIRRAQTPVIGLCFGAQLIAYMFGARLSRVQGEKIRGQKRIWNVKKTPFDFFLYYGGRVWASQRWRITELPDKLECWCASRDGVEVFKHIKKPIYGLQFHPEYHSGDNDGRRIFEKILELEFGNKKK